MGVVAPEPFAKAGEMFGKLKDLMPNNRKYYLNFDINSVNSQMNQKEREAFKKKILNGVLLFGFILRGSF